MILGPALAIGRAHVGAPVWTLDRLTYAPVYLFDTAVTASITADGSNNVSALADARGGSYTKSASSSGGAMPVIGGNLVDGRPALSFTRASSSKMRVDANAASLGNTPFAICEVARYTGSNDYAASLILGGAQTGGPFPENANLGTAGSKDWTGYLAQIPNSGGFFAGRNGSESREAVDTSAPHARLLISDGWRTRLIIDGTTQLEAEGLTWQIKSKEIALGGEATTGFGQTMDHRSYYGFAQYNASGTMSLAEIREFWPWLWSQFPSLKPTRRAIVHGTSIDRNYPNASGINSAWLQLAANAASATWQVRNYSVVGIGAGKLPNANGTALYGNGGTATAPTAGVAPNACAMWSSIWDIRPGMDDVFFSGTLAENDGFYGATPTEMFSYLQILGALVLAAGGIYVVCTPLPRQDAGTPVDYETNRQTLLTSVRANWSGNLSAVFVDRITNASPIAVTTQLPHGLATGATVSIALVQGCTAANGTGLTITVTGPSSFTIDGSTGNGSYTGAGVVYWGSGLGGSRLLDFDADANMPDPTNTADYNADKVHPVQSAQTNKMAPLATTVLDSL